MRLEGFQEAFENTTVSKKYMLITPEADPGNISAVTVLCSV